MSTKNQTVAQYKAEIKALKLALSQAKITKTDSEYFLNTKGQTQSWSGLSETKRYFETHHPEFLNQLNNGQKMTGNVFHKKLSEKLGL
jgi:uracil-DNA glycosylase